MSEDDRATCEPDPSTFLNSALDIPGDSTPYAEAPINWQTTPSAIDTGCVDKTGSTQTDLTAVEACNLSAHPYATIFPELCERDLEELAEDIKANGQRDPILVFDGAILDGRNRLKACKLAGVEPRVENLDGLTPADALKLALSMNLHRRHLSESQRAMVGARLGSMLGTIEGDEPANLPVPALTQADRARLMNVSERSIRSAETVQRESPELASEVSKGKTTVSRAEKQLRARNGNPSDSSKSKLVKSQPTKAKLASPAELLRQFAKLADDFTIDDRVTPAECVNAARVACEFVRRLLPRISVDEHAKLRMRAFGLEPEDCGEVDDQADGAVVVAADAEDSVSELDRSDRAQPHEREVLTIDGAHT